MDVVGLVLLSALQVRELQTGAKDKYSGDR
jgi:hypothetical protein